MIKDCLNCSFNELWPFPTLCYTCVGMSHPNNRVYFAPKFCLKIYDEGEV